MKPADELFPAEAVTMDSPRLAWMKRHKVVTFLSMPEDRDWRCWFAAFCHHRETPPKDIYSYFAIEMAGFGDSRTGEGKTEDEAIVDLCKKWSVKLWNEEAAG